MNLLQRLLARVMPQQPNADRGFNFGRTLSGEPVDEDNALKYAAVWRCVDVRAKAVAILPWSVFEKTKTGRKERGANDDIRWLLHNQPNPEMSPYQFKHMLVTHESTWGNAYCEIERDGAGRPKWLWPITPDRVTPYRVASGAIRYQISNSGTGPSYIEAADMLHVRGMGFDGLVGYSPIRKAAESIGLSVAMEKFGASFFGNGANMGGVFQHPKSLGPPARKNLEDSMQRRAGGDNANKWIVLEEGMTAARMAIPPNEAQFLESRDHQVIDICRWFGVPPHKVFALDRATWSNIEHQELEFVSDAVQPIVTQLEQEADLKLFGRVNRGVVYTKLNMAALLRGDMKSRYEAYEVAHRNGWLNANEIRGLEELNPIKNGNLYVMQAQMVTREQIKEGKQPKTTPNPGDPIEEDDPGATDEVVDAVMRSQRMLNLTRKRQ